MKHFIIFNLFFIMSHLYGQNTEIRYINISIDYIEYCNYDFENHSCSRKQKSYFSNDSIVFIDCMEISLKQKDLVILDSITVSKNKELRSVIHEEIEPRQKGNSILIYYLIVNNLGVVESVFIEGSLNGYRIDPKADKAACRFLMNKRIHKGWSDNTTKLLLLSIRY